MEHINIIINNIKIQTNKNKTILQVVKEFNLDEIPTLCHDDRLESYSSCFLCAVEIEGMNKLVPACSTQVSEGMIIHTNNKKIFESRKAALELLLSSHYADCIGPCTNNCPASVDVQSYISLISQKKYERALELIKQSNPMPLSIGRVCVRNCEEVCRRCYVEDPIAINFLKRYVADLDNLNWKPKLKINNDFYVAIIGGGPAGLTCAYYLRLEGFTPVIFEKQSELGGMLKYGIPEFRLPKKLLDSEIKSIIDLGVGVKTNQEMGKDFNIESLFRDGFNSIYISVGASKASSMGLDRETEIDGIYKGIDFLNEITNNKNSKLYGIVIIIGGGNTAIDAARTALRLGAVKVMIVYRRTIKEMPAHETEIQAAIDEGVEIKFLTNPKSIIQVEGRITGIECYKMKLEESKAGERPKPVIIPDSEFIINCDFLISAIGQQVDVKFIEQEKNFKLEKWGTVFINKDTFETSIPGVFAGGDVVSGALTAVNAIGHGKKAAQSIIEFLKTGEIKNKKKKFYSFKHRFGDIPENEFSQIKIINREKMPELPVSIRKNNFVEIELGFNFDQVVSETQRCLECGCSEYYDCSLRKYADEFEIDISDYIGEVKKYKLDKRHAYIILDSNKCINCGKCVRVCSEILSVSALGFVYRGFKSIVKPAMEKSLLETNCISCGNCIDLCPTGAISEKFHFKNLGTLPKLNKETICNFCSVGCKMNYKIIDEDLFYVSNSTEEIKNSINNGYLCSKGRFGYRLFLENNRIHSASIKINNNFNKIDISEAIKYSSNKIKNIIKKYGAESVAVFASPKMTNEDLYLIQKFARVGLKTNNISSFSNIINNTNNNFDNNFEEEFTGIPVSSINIEDIKNTDVIIVLNSNILEENLIIDLKIKEAKKKGAKLILISSFESDLNKYADVWLDSRKGTNTVLLNGFIQESLKNSKSNYKYKSILEDYNKDTISNSTGIEIKKYEAALNLIKNPETNIIFIYNSDYLKEKSKFDLRRIYDFMYLTDRISKINNGILILRDHSNSVGLQDMGVSPDFLPGYINFDESDEINKLSKLWKTNLFQIFKPVDLLKDMLDNKIKAAIIFGEDPLIYTENLKYFNQLEFLLVMDTNLTETSNYSNIIIPMNNHLENNGTFTSFDTKIQKFNKIINNKNINNKNNFDNLKIIFNLAAEFSKKFSYKNSDEIFKEITEINRIYQDCKYEEYWNKKESNKKLLYERNKFEFKNLDLNHTTYYNKNKLSILYSDNFYNKNIKSKLYSINY